MGKKPPALQNITNGAAELNGVPQGNAGAIDANFSSEGIHHPVDHPKEGGLPTAAGAD
jgi:hypothetical protein